MARSADVLRGAIADAIAGIPERDLAAATAHLSALYREVAPASSAILATSTHVAAYAAFRMPATAAVLARVLSDVAESMPPTWLPARHLDIGAGTGAAAFAAWSVLGTASVTLVDRVPEALNLATCILDAAGVDDLVVRPRLGLVGDVSHLVPGERFALVTVGHVLSELSEPERAAVLREASAAVEPGGALVVTEPGTPDGYGRVIAVRAGLIEADWQLLGPCPHAANCPLAQGDWCHFGERVERSVTHRRIKGAALSYEDEKYAWVAARNPALDPAQGGGGQWAASDALAGQQDWSRILRRPLIRKGFVEFSVCRPDGTAGREVVSKKQGARYRTARDAQWGDRLPGQTTP